MEIGEQLKFDYTGDVQEVVLPAGQYKFECWGAQGGKGDSGTAVGGKGGYSIGNYTLKSKQTIYVYVGEMGGTRTATKIGGWNGGGNGGLDSGSGQNGGHGGGATDIRIGGNDLYSRIIVAGAGGGGGRVAYGGRGGGEGGTIAGADNSGVSGGAGTQSEGGKAHITTRGATDGKLGQGGNGSTDFNSAGGGGGGGGYYGGGGGTSTQNHGSGYSCGGGGGSGYIGNMIDGQTIVGISVMPSPSGGTQTGQEGNGYCIITCLELTTINAKCKLSGQIKQINDMKVKVNGTWKNVTKTLTKINGIWK